MFRMNTLGILGDNGESKYTKGLTSKIINCSMNMTASSSSKLWYKCNYKDLFVFRKEGSE